jgi:hypothetical protein
LLLTFAVNLGLKIHRIDISTAFMYGEIEEEVNFKISEGFEKEYQENFVYKFNKVLNGLKQVPRLWNNT